MKFEITQQIIKLLIYHISWKSVHSAPSCSESTDRRTDRQTDRYDKVNSNFFPIRRICLKIEENWISL